jgi:hypothetical protein
MDLICNHVAYRIGADISQAWQSRRLCLLSDSSPRIPRKNPDLSQDVCPRLIAYISLLLLLSSPKIFHYP